MTPYGSSVARDSLAGLVLRLCLSCASQPVMARSRCALAFLLKCGRCLTPYTRGVQTALLQKVTRERVGEELDKMMGGTMLREFMKRWLTKSVPQAEIPFCRSVYSMTCLYSLSSSTYRQPSPRPSLRSPHHLRSPSQPHPSFRHFFDPILHYSLTHQSTL